MNRVLIVYGTTEGHTRRICETLASALDGVGVPADVVEAGTSDPDPAPYDGIIVVGSVHAGRYQRSLVKWVRARAAEFGDRPTMFVSVSLAAATRPLPPAVAVELTKHIDYFHEITGWWPGRVSHVAGALLYTHYSFFKRVIMKRIVASHGGDTDTSRDYEYTDWAAVERLAAEFGRGLKAAA